MPLKRTRPTVDEHIRLGQAIKDAESAMLNVLEFSRFMSKSEVERLAKEANYGFLCHLKSRFEDVMFDDYPDLGPEYMGVYYHIDERFVKDNAEE